MDDVLYEQTERRLTAGISAGTERTDMVKDFYSIQEFAKITGVEASRLRFWDDIGLFSPAMRNPDNNYRYYTLPQITAVNFVAVLSDLNIPLKTIGELRKDRDPENFIKLLEKREKELDIELRLLRQRSSVIHARRELINYGMKVDDSEVAVLHRDDKELILWPRNEYGEGSTFIEPLAAFVSRADEERINLDFPVGGYWDSFESFHEHPSRPDCFFSIDPTGTHLRKEGKYLVGFSRGYYSEMGDLPERMASYIKENKLHITGPLYVIYLHDEICTPDTDQYLAQACVMVDRYRKYR